MLAAAVAAIVALLFLWLVWTLVDSANAHLGQKQQATRQRNKDIIKGEWQRRFDAVNKDTDKQE